MFEIENFAVIKTIHPFEWTMLGIYCLVIFGITFARQAYKIEKNKLYRFYGLAVLAKIASSVVFCLIYIYYYQGGDTISYYESARALVNLGMKDLSGYLDVITSSPSLGGYMTFDQETGFPWPYLYYDTQTFFVAKLISPLVLLSFKSYLVSSVLLSWLTFFGVWQFYLTLCRYFPKIETRLAIGVLFVPSVLFWSSGILKDSITFTAVCWFIVMLDNLLRTKQGRLRNATILILSLYLLLSIKPYILYSLFPGAIIWIASTRMKRIHSKFIRITIAPLIIVLSISLGYLALSLLGSRMGKFSVPRLLETAVVTQRDLKQDYYQGSSFDIGEFDATFSGMISKVPAAMTVGLFRPYIWEARNVVMLLSGVENLFYLLVVVFLIFKIFSNPKLFFQVLRFYPVITFLICFTLFFSVMVGLSTSNFGALVRFKIPFMSSFLAVILVLHYLLSKKGIVEQNQLMVSNSSPSGYRPSEKR